MPRSPVLMSSTAWWPAVVRPCAPGGAAAHTSLWPTCNTYRFVRARSMWWWPTICSTAAGSAAGTAGAGAGGAARSPLAGDDVFGRGAGAVDGVPRQGGVARRGHDATGRCSIELLAGERVESCWSMPSAGWTCTCWRSSGRRRRRNWWHSISPPAGITPRCATSRCYAPLERAFWSTSRPLAEGEEAMAGAIRTTTRWTAWVARAPRH